ncbi:hypothetical protein C0Q70_06946 [Pomacea canaliculata]|uniref:Potassium channel tetramerisation-type BTB domain-containing protein n=1 Tax=Pomacea canaliculata TaxID=400727 RepID=A0A2T7PDP4_POMCA|nr:hypothetical protein C0Q70_06946 [Pomacea canaliculata]
MKDRSYPGSFAGLLHTACKHHGQSDFERGRESVLYLLESLNRLPETKLGKLSKSGVFSNASELFFDRNPKVMHGILDLYRTGELHLPNNLCSTLIRKELEFWEVPEELISECCWKTYQSSKTSKCIIDHIDLSLSDPYGLAHQDAHHLFPLSTRLWLALEHPNHSLKAKVRADVSCLLVPCALT